MVFLKWCFLDQKVTRYILKNFLEQNFGNIFYKIM